MSAHRYDTDVHPENAYGHALDLLGRHLPEHPSGVHLDLACGFGHIAEHVTDFGLTYLGSDYDDVGLEALRSRGYETFQADLNHPQVLDRLREALAGRPLVSVTCLDGLEHLGEGEYLHAALGTLLAESGGLLVISVPNVTHFDVAVRTLLGQWTYTDTGLLDRTHYRLYSDTSLRAAMAAGGLTVVDEYNVAYTQSDQHFPVGHVGQEPGTTIGQHLRGLRHRAEPHEESFQFLWALKAAGVAEAGGAPLPEQEPPAEIPKPFLSVLVQVTAANAAWARAALLALAAQSSTDFEVVLVAAPDVLEVAERLRADQAPYLQWITRIVAAPDGLDGGLAKANGRYVAVLEEHQLPLSTWVAALSKVELDNYVRALRVGSVTPDGSPSSPSEFALVPHLTANLTPAAAWAFPISVFRDFAVAFADTGPWGMLIEAAQLCGVTDLGGVHVVAPVPGQDPAATSAVRARFADRPILVPAGELTA